MKPLYLVLPLFVLLSGCQTSQEATTLNANSARAKSAQDSRIAAMRQQWLGKTRDQLVASMGRPAQVMDATLLGRTPTEAYVYAPGPESAGCVDAFSITEETGVIEDYFCR